MLLKAENVKIIANFAAHEKVAKEEALLSLAALFEFIQWLDYYYGKNYCERLFNKNLYTYQDYRNGFVRALRRISKPCLRRTLPFKTLKAV